MPRPIYLVDLSVGAYCARPPMSVSSTGFSAFSSRGTISPSSFLQALCPAPPRRSRPCLSDFEPSSLGVSTLLGSSSASGFGVCDGVSSGASQGPVICLGVVRSSPPSRPVSAGGFHPIRVGPRVDAASAPLQVVRSALTVSWVSVV
ncbi:hypothetical protein NDU88_005128 [Pleurodeles waltl]|uniref:Uncharacterized protein n=1 Tax=Pleurodeles waltl TaxID=8319 RepID=A0AAV7SKY7_PLEWA|nr:hypothetical protein NDU88_005128 [Pleurodeles waltl]